MNNIQALTAFFGWCSVINIGVLLLSTLAMMLMKDMMVRVHSRMFGVSQSDLPMLYIKYLGHYKIAIFIFNVVPYFALKLMV